MRNCGPGAAGNGNQAWGHKLTDSSAIVKTTANNKCSKFILNYKVYYADIRDDTMYIMYIILHN